MNKVTTQHVFPPIPFRGFDWCATLDSYEGGDPVGHGATEAAAVADLLEQVEATPPPPAHHLTRIMHQLPVDRMEQLLADVEQYAETRSMDEAGEELRMEWQEEKRRPDRFDVDAQHD